MAGLVVGRNVQCHRLANFMRSPEALGGLELPIYRVRGPRPFPRYGRRFSSASYGSWKEDNNGKQAGSNGKQSFRSRLRVALGKTKIEWYPIPVSLGIAFLGLAQFVKTQRAERARLERELSRDEPEDVPRRKRIRPTGPWQVQVMSTLPLKAMSRLWGRFNELVLPYYFRVPGFRLYSWVFGVNLDEIAQQDLHQFPNLASFFYRELKPGVRPLDPNPSALLSPADGRILQFGRIENGEVEQVKGMTYSLDALLGHPDTSSSLQVVKPATRPVHHGEQPNEKHFDNVAADEEFAKVNGISYSLPTLLSGSRHSEPTRQTTMDASTTSSPNSEVEVKADLAKGQVAWYMRKPHPETALYYVVLYLAPGDYHRFHSPTSWVVESRRHFAGELYSVSPYLQRTLPGLFTLNERVVLLGHWRWGFFSLTPVGATNVGSIKINFDSELRTNSLVTDTAADKAAAEAAKRGEIYPGFAEATYRYASRTLGGHALQRGEEMGGFQLGSSIVLVFEAPVGCQESPDHSPNKEDERGWCWRIEKGERVKYGQAIGEVI